jgi:hypothetical protein
MLTSTIPSFIDHHLKSLASLLLLLQPFPPTPSIGPHLGDLLPVHTVHSPPYRPPTLFFNAPYAMFLLLPFHYAAPLRHVSPSTLSLRRVTRSTPRSFIHSSLYHRLYFDEQYTCPGIPGSIPNFAYPKHLSVLFIDT